MTQAVVDTQRFDPSLITRIGNAKKQSIERSGVLEFFPADQSMADVAGLRTLKSWLKKRKAIFINPQGAKEFGLSAPKGILLLGVQGCGKSLCAKAVASEWSLPLVRLDPSNIYQKYLGESEKT